MMKCKLYCQIFKEDLQILPHQRVREVSLFMTLYALCHPSLMIILEKGQLSRSTIDFTMKYIKCFQRIIQKYLELGND